MTNTLGFIGCGNMGGALIRAVLKTVEAKKVAVCDVNESKAKAFAEEYGVKTLGAKGTAMFAKYIVLGVKPQNMQEAVKEIAPLLTENHVLITMAAGVSMQAIRSFAGKNLPIVRIMPNTPAALGEGMILYDTLDVSADTEQEFLEMFSMAGKMDKLPEDKIDAASALSGCGPAFVYAFAEALADGAVECGVPRDKAAAYAAQTLLGAARMLQEYGHPADLKDAVCSPGGTTIAGIHALEKAGFRGATMDAVHAAYNRTLELKK